MDAKLNIRRIDSRRDDLQAALDELRQRLGPRGDVVSEAGRRRTVEVFGEPLTPQQVVERICLDVREKGLAAVLEYSSRIDKAELTAETLRVPQEDLAKALSFWRLCVGFGKMCCDFNRPFSTATFA